MISYCDTRSFLPKIAKGDKAIARLWLATDMHSYMGVHDTEHVRCVITSHDYPEDTEALREETERRYSYSSDILQALEELSY